MGVRRRLDVRRRRRRIVVWKPLAPFADGLREDLTGRGFPRTRLSLTCARNHYRLPMARRVCITTIILQQSCKRYSLTTVEHGVKLEMSSSGPTQGPGKVVMVSDLSGSR